MRKLIFALLILCTLSIFGVFFHQESERVQSYKINAWSDDHIADCAVVLTGGSGRVREGFDLLEQGRIQKLVISGVNPASSLYQIFPQLPLYSRINENDVILEKRSGTTYGNAIQSLPLVEALRCRSVLVVTSTLHMHRALRTFSGYYPSEVSLKPHGIVSGHAQPRFAELFVEVLKSMFYALWAY